MAEHNILGHEGESAATLYLMLHGYAIREIDWRWGHCDIDIIAEKFGLLIFVEVKTRSSERFERAEEAVDKQKQRNILDAANAYIHMKRLDMPCRFDIITAVGKAPNFDLRHIKDAFNSATWRGETEFNGGMLRQPKR